MIDISINRAPRLGLFTFDAVLETTTQGSVKLTNIPLESGAEINDHRIRNPNTYTMRGAVSNSPLKQGIDDILSLGLGVISNITQADSSNTALNLGSSYLAGTNGVRAATSSSLLFSLKDSGDPITVLTGLMILKDMVIKDVQILQDPDTDNGFIFVAQLQEYMYVKSLKNEAPVEEMDPGIQAAASPKSSLGNVGLEKTENQGWANDAFNNINEWTGGLLN